MKKLVFIKLGGSIITEKNTAMTARLDMISGLAKEISDVAKTRNDIQFIIGNGAGSFGHYQVIQYKLKDGITSQEQWYGYSIVQGAVSMLNNLVVKSLQQEQLPVVTIQPSAIFTANNGKPETVSLRSFFKLLENEVIPSFYGDIIVDTARGCTIFSTETIFDILINASLEKKIDVDMVIHLTKVPGVLDDNKKVIKEITAENWPSIQKFIAKTDGYDITGGMKHKIEASLLYAKKGIKTIIADGEKKGILKDIFIENKASGTTIK